MNTKVKKSSIILMILLIFTISLGAISAADSDSADESLNQAEDIGLEEAQSDIDESQDILTATDVNKTFTDFNTDITDKTEVDLESNYVYSDGDTSYKNGFTIDRELTINGNGQTLNPNGNLLFKIGSSGKLTLNDLTIVNSYTSTDAMIQNSGNLILNNVTFTVERHILSSVSSGAKFITIQNDGEMTVNNSNFINSLIYSDHISSTSKQINIYGLIYNNNKITIENTVFDGNKLVNPSENKLGRTIDICAVLHNANNMVLNNVVISNTNVNYVPSGNAHFEGIIFNEKGKLEINGSIIKDNTINFPSNENSNLQGVIYNEATTAEIIMTNSIIADNTHTQTNAVKPIMTNKGIATLDNNYWGTNNPDFSILITGSTPSNYAVLNFTTEDVTTGQEKTFDIAFKVNDEIQTTMPNYTVTVNSQKLGSKDVEIKNGVGQYTYLPITAGEDTITINSAEYTINVNAAPAGTFTDLNNTIAANDEVNLYSNYTYDASSDSALQTGIPIDKEVIINGNGYTINSTSLAGLFNIGTTGKLTLKNIVLVADYASATGNIINEGTLSLDKVSLSSTKTSGNTELGAVIVNKGILSIQDSELIDSVINSQADAGIIYGLIYNEGNATIEQTLFNNNKLRATNTATTKGMIYNKGKLTFNNNIVNNTESNVICIEDENSETVIGNCTIENTANSQAIYISSGSASISNSLFTNNNGAIYSKGTLTATKNIFRNNNANEGGAIYSTGSADIQNSIFEGNTANTGQAIYSTGTLNANNNYWATNTPNFENLIEGTAPQNYVIIKIEGESNLIPESEVVYTVNFKTNDSEALLELPDYTVDLSATNTLSDDSVTIKKGTASFTYTAPITEGSDIIKASVDNDERSTFEVSIAEDPTAKGTFKELDRFIRKSDSEFDLIKNYTFDSIIDTGFENGITIGKEITINGHGFTINSTDLAKLFNVVSGGKLILKDVMLETDYATSGSSSNIYTEAGFKNAGEVNLNNVTFTTKQEVTSGSIAFSQPIYNTGTLNIRDSKFVDSTINTNTQYCYGLIYNNQGNVIIENTIFDKNSMIDTTTYSSSYLAGLIHNQGTLTLNNINMTNNYMKTPNNIRGLIRAYSNSKLTINNCRFENNTVESVGNNAQGTVIYADSGTMEISNSKFINNNGAKSGGAIFSSIATTFTNNTFERNTAGDSGGAIYSSGSSSIYINNTFKDNVAQNGGALYSSVSLQSSKSYFFTGNTFIGNNATKLGGAIYGSTMGTPSAPMDNNTFIKNYALEKGGAIYSSNAVRVKNSLFEGNTAGEGVILYINGNYAATFSYSIFDDNVITSTTGGLFYATSSSTFDYNYWGTNAPVFSDLIKLRSGTLTAPTNFAIITIEGNNTISENTNYTVNFKNNATGDIIELQDYTVDLTAELNAITPANVVITKGTASFTYNVENFGEDTIKAMRNNAEKASLNITVKASKQTPEFTIVAGNVTYGDPLNLTFTLTNGPTGENIYKWTIFSKSGLLLETGNVTADNKIISTIKNAGNYTIQVALTNVEGWNDLTVNDTFEIKQVKTEIKTDITVNDNATVTIKFNITSNDQLLDVEGSISFEVDTTYQENVEHGQTSITTNVLSPNTYTVTVTYSGDENHADQSTNIKFTIEPEEEVNDNGTFTELNRLINGSHIVDLEHDHTFNVTIDSDLENGITIDKEVTINGNGFTINSTDLAKLFNVVAGGKLTLNDVVIETYYVATGTYSAARPLASFANAGEVTLNNVTFTTKLNVDSTAKALVAPIYNVGTLNIKNSKFVDSSINTNTPYCFGLIDNNGGNLNIENTIFDKNSMIDNSTESDVYANGLIYNMGTLTLTNVNMTNNYMKTPSASRGLIRGYTNSQITIENSIFENNKLEYTGKYAQGTVIYAESGTMEISNSKFINNTGAKLGGAIYSSIGATFINNTFERNIATNNGGAISIGAKETVFINNVFKDNNAGENGGAIYTTSSIQSSKSYLFTGNTFIGNNATKYGGAVHVASIGSNTYPIENNTFINNFAGEKGGAIYSTGTLKITKTLFSKNTAGEGAIAYTTGTSSSTITYSLFDGNVMTSPTGGLLRYASSSTADYNYWGTNSPDFDELIKVASGTATKPTNIIIIAIEGNETLYESDVYAVNFKDNVTGDIVELFNYTVDLSATLNTVTPTSIVISEGSAFFTYNAENKGTDTIRVMKDNVEVTSFDVIVSSPKQTPEFTIVANDVNYGDALNLTFTVIAGPTGENIYKWTIFSKSGLLLETGNVTEDNKIITTNTYNSGNYTIEVKLSDNDEWNDLTVNDTFEIKAAQSEIKPTVTINDDDTVTIDINLTSNDQPINVGGEISFEIDTTYNKIVENGQTTVTTNKLTPENYTIVISYTGDGNYAASATEIKFTIKQTIVMDDVLNITPSDDNKTYTYTIKLPQDATGNLTVSVGNRTENKTLENGEATIILDGLNPGIQEVTITYTGDDNYKPATKIDTINVPEEPKNPEFTIVANDITYGDPLNLTFTVIAGPTGENIYKWTIFSKNGLLLETGNVTADNKIITTNTYNAGNYTIQVALTNVEGWNDLTVNDTFEIKNVTDSRSEIPDDEINVSMSIPEGTTSPTFNITLPKDANGTFTVYVDGKAYEKQLVNGSATITVEDLTVGDHNISTAYSGDDKYKGFATENQTTNIPKAAIPGGDSVLNPTTPEGSDSPSYSINLPSDAKGNLTATVDGENHTAPLVNGSATVTVPKLAPGNHNITVAYTGDEKYSSISKTSTYTVKEPVVKITENKDVTMLYTAKTPYKVLITVDGKAVGAGEVVKMTFNGKTYEVKTDKNGYATLKLPDVKPKKAKYTITAEYKGVKVSNKVKVNSIIKAKNKKVKKSKKVNKIKVTLKKVNGKFLKGKKLTLKIKGKKIKAKTNKKGVATFKVKKNVLKKLKVGKKYKYTVTFGKDTVTKKLTIKK